LKILGINWVGVKTADFSQTRSSFAEVMGLAVSYEKADFAATVLPDGDKLEIFGPEGPDEATQFGDNSVVAGFRVEGIEAARAELQELGVVLLGETAGDPGGYQWQHFRAPDGKVFELCSDPRRQPQA